jgi:hypothetical protein
MPIPAFGQLRESDYRFKPLKWFLAGSEGKSFAMVDLVVKVPSAANYL